MDQKSHKVRVAALFSCLDEALKRMLSVHFAALPDVAVISDKENSYFPGDGETDFPPGWRVRKFLKIRFVSNRVFFFRHLLIILDGEDED